MKLETYEFNKEEDTFGDFEAKSKMYKGETMDICPEGFFAMFDIPKTIKKFYVELYSGPIRNSVKLIRSNMPGYWDVDEPDVPEYGIDFSCEVDDELSALSKKYNVKTMYAKILIDA